LETWGARGGAGLKVLKARGAENAGNAGGSRSRGGDMNVDIGGGVGGGEREDLVEVVAIGGGEARRVKIKKFLGFNVCSKTLKEGATETVYLSLGDGPGGIDAGSAA
jgi:hypothetical protein